MRRNLDNQRTAEIVPSRRNADTEEVGVRQLRTHSLERRPTVADAAARPRLRETPAEQHSRRVRNALLKAVLGDGGPNQRFADFFGEVAALMTSGMTIEEALCSVSEEAGPELLRISADAATQTAAGVPLSRALAGWQRSLPDIVVPIVEVGERSGSIQQSMRQLAEAFQRAAIVDRKFEYNPLLNPGLGLPALICGSMAFAPFFIENKAVFLAYCAACIVTAGTLWTRRYRSALRQPRTVWGAKRSLHPSRAGTGRSYLATARWGRTFATLWQCGVPISTALEVASRSARNAHYERALRAAATRTRQGYSLHDSLADTKLLPPQLLEIIQTGEASGDLGPAIDAFANFAEDDAKMLAAQVFTMKHLLPVVIIVMGIALMMLSPVVGLLFIGAALVGMNLMFRLAVAGER